MQIRNPDYNLLFQFTGTEVQIRSYMLLMNKKEKANFYSIKASWHLWRENTEQKVCWVQNDWKSRFTTWCCVLTSTAVAVVLGVGGRSWESVKRQSTHHYNKPSAAVCSLGYPRKNSLPPKAPSGAARSATEQLRNARVSFLWSLCRESTLLVPAAFARIPHVPS